MNKKLMLLGLCMMGVFSAVQADETVSTDAPAVIKEETTVDSTEKPVDEKGCGCKR